MTIQEAKQKASELNNSAVNRLLQYIGFLEKDIEEREKVNQAHRGLVGDLYKQVDEK